MSFKKFGVSWRGKDIDAVCRAEMSPEKFDEFKKKRGYRAYQRHAKRWVIYPANSRSIVYAEEKGNSVNMTLFV